MGSVWGQCSFAFRLCLHACRSAGSGARSPAVHRTTDDVRKLWVTVDAAGISCSYTETSRVKCGTFPLAEKGGLGERTCELTELNSVMG